MKNSFDTVSAANFGKFFELLEQHKVETKEFLAQFSIGSILVLIHPSMEIGGGSGQVSRSSITVNGGTISFGGSPIQMVSMDGKGRELTLSKPLDLAEAMAKAKLFEDRYDTKWVVRRRIIQEGDCEDESSQLDEINEGELGDPTFKEVSLNSLSNSSNLRIFRLQAKHITESLGVLINTGSNNNFIQESLAIHLGIPCEETKVFKVYMGNGNSLVCLKVCHGVELLLQGHQFTVDLYVLLIWGLDVVFGMEWLGTLGPCVHDHKELTMEFQWKGQAVKLAGNSELAAQQLSANQFHVLLHEGEVHELYNLCSTEKDIAAATNKIECLEKLMPPAGKGLIREFNIVFEEPTKLPPQRNVDHCIFLQLGSAPVNVRPYRYPYFQKDIIEKLVQEMRAYGFCRPSRSPYSSPVLQVKKKDRTWHLCVDYGALNELTIKDRFPIATIDELLQFFLS
uniref:Uncharacterized protein n=1 Tax=Cannabis sativa TaxID=3483 RepID=A0A803PMN4_CANSA